MNILAYHQELDVERARRLKYQRRINAALGFAWFVVGVLCTSGALALLTR